MAKGSCPLFQRAARQQKPDLNACALSYSNAHASVKYATGPTPNPLRSFPRGIYHARSCQ